MKFHKGQEDDPTFDETILTYAFKKIKNTVEFIQDSTNQFQPQIGIILGTGLGVINDVIIEHEIEYEDIPSFPISTVESHKGKITSLAIIREESDYNAGTISLL